MKNKNNYLRTLFLLIGVLLCQQTNAQDDCQCELMNTRQSDSLTTKNDTTIFQFHIQQLAKSKNVFCKFYEREIRINYLIAQRNIEFLDLIKEQEALIKTTNCSSEYLGLVYRNYCVYYKYHEDYENLSKYSFLHLAHAEKIGNQREEYSALRNIVHLFTMQNEDEKIMKYVSRAHKLMNKMKAGPLLVDPMIWSAMNYEALYVLTNDKKYLDTAFVDVAKALRLAKQYDDKINMAEGHRIYDALYYHKGNLPMAIKHIDSAIAILKSVNMPTNITALYLSKAWNYTDLKNNPSATQWLDTAIGYSEKLSPGTMALANTYYTASEIYDEFADAPNGYKYFKKYAALKDSLFSNERTETINELEQKYFKAKNEKTIKELSQQQKIYWLLIAAAFLGLIALVFFIRQQSLKNKQKILETEQRLNRARMNPHFFFNALSSIQSFALQGHDGLSIATNISKFSHIMRETLESTYKEYVTIEQEMDFLNEYLELQKMRFPQKYTYDIDCEDAIDPDAVLIPSMILQPFVENSIEHGFVGIDKVGELSIDFKKENDNLLITIEDNGKGLTNKVKDDNEHISRAGQIIKDRIMLLNLKLKTTASFSIENKVDEQGVLVKIKLPYLKK